MRPSLRKSCHYISDIISFQYASVKLGLDSRVNKTHSFEIDEASGSWALEASQQHITIEGRSSCLLNHIRQ